MSMRSHVSEKRRARLGDDSVAALAETFKVLGDVTRVRILDALAHSEVSVCRLAEDLGVTQSAVSHQLRLLRSMRLVKSRRAGRHIYYMMDDDHIVRLFEQGLEHVEERQSSVVSHQSSVKRRQPAADRRRTSTDERRPAEDVRLTTQTGQVQK